MSGCLTSRPKAAQPAWFTRWARGSHRWPTLSQLRRQHYPAFPRTCDTDGVKNWRCSAPSKGSFDGPISGFSSVVAFVSTFALLVSLELWAFTAPSSAEFISYGLARQDDGLLTLDNKTGPRMARFDFNGKSVLCECDRRLWGIHHHLWPARRIPLGG